MNEDHCTPEGARRLAKRIEAYWKARGHDVTCELVEGAFTQPMRSARTDIRSDMVGGLPRTMKGVR